MLVQSKAVNSTLLTSRGSGAGRVRFQGAKERPAEGKELNALVSNAVKAVLTTNTSKNAKVSSDSRSQYEQEHFKFKISRLGVNNKQPIRRGAMTRN